MVSRRCFLSASLGTLTGWGLGILTGCTHSEISQSPVVQGSRQAPADVPLPGNIAVTPPPAGTSPSVAFFSGEWVGSFDGNLSHILVVETILGSTAYVVYAWGRTRQFDPGWVRKKAEISEGVLTVDVSHSGDTVTATYTPQTDGTLSAVYEIKGSKNISKATMQKIPF